MPGERITVIEDDAAIQELLRYNLDRNGYRVDVYDRAEPALAAIRRRPPDLLLLDIMLPGLDGLDVCRQLKADPATARLPIIMISARGEEADIVIGLELGADDYLAKPFSPRVLLARVKAVLRRQAGEADDAAAPLRRGPLEIDPGRHQVRLAGAPVPLTPTEFGILYLLAGKPGWVFTRQQIVDAVRGEDYAVTERSVDVQIVGLRRKLGDGAAVIETVRGIGYRFAGDLED